MENTISLEIIKTPNGDHLHIRGEHGKGKEWVRVFIGSSPHTWRTPNFSVLTTAYSRIISTYVENTSLGHMHIVCVWDHLHIRGEHFRKILEPLNSIGSSPHTWRTLEWAYSTREDDRIISTYVENTQSEYHFAS